MSKIVFCVTIALLIVKIRAQTIDNLNEVNGRSSDTEVEVNADKPYFVPLCYREGKYCCNSFEERCLDHNECKDTEICCLANCTIQCYDISLLGQTQDNEQFNTETDYLDSDPDFIRFTTSTDSDIEMNRTDCYNLSVTCCSRYLKRCHDDSDCEGDDNICCNQNCGTVCYPKSKIGVNLFPDEDLNKESNSDNEDNSEPVMITANQTEDGTLTIVVKHLKP